MKIGNHTYGINLTRSIGQMIVCNIPLINRIYARKVEVHAVSRDKHGLPIQGVFGYFYIPKKLKKVEFSFSFPDGGRDVFLYVRDFRTEEHIGEKVYERTTPCHPFAWYPTFVWINQDK